MKSSTVTRRHSAVRQCSWLTDRKGRRHTCSQVQCVSQTSARSKPYTEDLARMENLHSYLCHITSTIIISVWPSTQFSGNEKLRYAKIIIIGQAASLSLEA